MSVGIAGREPASIAGVGARVADIAYQKDVSHPRGEQFLGSAAGDGVSGALGQGYSHYQILLRATRRQQRIIALAKFLKRGKRIFAAGVCRRGRCLTVAFRIC